MKKLIILSAFAAFATMTSCNNAKTDSGKVTTADSTKNADVTTTQTFNFDTTKLESGSSYYQCEMDPEVLSDKAGNCPKCGMELSEMKKQ